MSGTWWLQIKFSAFNIWGEDHFFTQMEKYIQLILNYKSEINYILIIRMSFSQISLSFVKCQVFEKSQKPEAKIPLLKYI